MATKKHAKNGKAKREKIATFDTGFIPPPCETLTPDRAAQWLKVDHGHWQEYASRMVSGGNLDSWITDSIDRMVKACTHALESGKPVQLEASELSCRSWLGVKTSLEHLAAALSEPINQEFEFENMREPIAAVLGNLIETADRAYTEKVRQEKPFESPQQRFERIHAAIESDDKAELNAYGALANPIEAAIDRLKEQIIGVIEEPYDRRHELLEYERKLLVCEHYRDEPHPGKPPEGFKGVRE